jgi:hypothetical protein
VMYLMMVQKKPEKLQKQLWLKFARPFLVKILL